MDDDDVLSSPDTRRWTLNWPVDEPIDRRHTFKRTPLAQDTQLPLHRTQQDGEELEDLLSPY